MAAAIEKIYAGLPLVSAEVTAGGLSRPALYAALLAENESLATGQGPVIAEPVKLSYWGRASLYCRNTLPGKWLVSLLPIWVKMLLRRFLLNETV